MNEAHIQHTVGFIQYQNLNLIQLHGILMFEVERASGVAAASTPPRNFICGLMLTPPNTTSERILRYLLNLDVFANLRRQLAGWREDQHAPGDDLCLMRLVGKSQMLQQWQG